MFHGEWRWKIFRVAIAAKCKQRTQRCDSGSDIVAAGFHDTNKEYGHKLMYKLW